MDDNKPIRILQVLTAMNRAGTETMIMNIYRAIDRSKVQFDFAVSATEKCDYDDEINSLGGRIFYYPRYQGSNHFKYKKWWESFFVYHPEYRVVHGHIGSTASIYLKIAKKHGCYAIAHSHSTGSGFGIQKLLYKLYSYPTRNIADYFIGCSTEALVARYGEKVASNHDISVVLQNGIDVDKYAFSESVRESVCEELGLNKESLIVGTVGRFVPPKNPLFIVDIIDRLNRCQEDFTFLWAGTGELKPEVEKLIKEKNLQKKVILLGVRTDIPRILQTFNVFILPSKYEGLPVIGVEVQAAGVPMLCSDKVSPEVRMTQCCRFLPIDSSEVWADEIVKEKVFRRVENASEDVIKAGYDIHETSRWLLDLYESNWN